MRRHIPNAITGFRLALVPFLAASLLEGARLASLALLSTAAATDWLDGRLARLWRVESRFGALLDPLADKLTQLTALIVLASEPPGFTPVPRFLVVLVLVRDLWLLYGALRIRTRRGRVAIVPRWPGKASTLIVFALAIAAAAGAPDTVVLALSLAAAVPVVVAVVAYTEAGRRQME